MSRTSCNPLNVFMELVHRVFNSPPRPEASRDTCRRLDALLSNPSELAASFSSAVLMASGADEPKDKNCPEVQSPDDAEALGATIMSVEEKMALCDVIFQDLLVVQRILKEKGFCDAAFQAEKNQSDFTP